jgi:anti-anti-sigma factor
MGRSNSPRPDEVAVKCKRAGKALVVHVGGELTLSTTEEFERALREAHSGRRLDIALELSRVHFIDSTGCDRCSESRTSVGRGV